MKKLILHIGRHKTGTSSLQRFLVENRGNLENHNIYYPNGGIQGFGHHLIAKSLSRKEMKLKNLDKVLQKPLFIDFLRELNRKKDSHNIVLSSEAFQNCNPIHVAEVFSSFNVEIHVYLREHASYLLSSYAQSVQATSNYMTLAEYEENVFHADYEKFINQWYEAFGRTSVNVYLFDKAHLTNGDIVQDFLKRILGFNESSRGKFIYSAKDQNPSLGGRLVEFKRLLNKNGIADGKGDSEIYQALKKMTLIDKYQDKIRMDKDIYYNLDKKYSEGNSRLSTEIFNDSEALRIKMPDVFETKNEIRLAKKDLDEMVKDFSILLPELASTLYGCDFYRKNQSLMFSSWQGFSNMVKKFMREYGKQ